MAFTMSRFVAATNLDIQSAIDSGEFRSDLFYRLNLHRIHLPPLRERGDDVELLAKRFLHRFAGDEGKPVTGLAADALDKIRRHRWPGNVRELQNTVRRAVVLALGPRIDAAAISLDTERRPLAPVPVAVVTDATAPEVVEPLAATERRAVENAVRLCEGNIPRAARLLDISPSTLYRKLQGWGHSLRPPAAKPD